MVAVLGLTVACKKENGNFNGKSYEYEGYELPAEARAYAEAHYLTYDQFMASFFSLTIKFNEEGSAFEYVRYGNTGTQPIVKIDNRYYLDINADGEISEMEKSNYVEFKKNKVYLYENAQIFLETTNPVWIAAIYVEVK